jgi:PAS domain S-box-containing protein
MSTGRSEPLLQATLLGEAIEHAPVGVFVFDDEGRYVAVNPYACEELGYTREELLELRLGDLAVSRRDAMRTYESVLTNGIAEATTRARRKDGTEVVLHFRARATKIGGITFYIAIAWPE